MIELKPCPFCGGNAHVEITSDFSGSGGIPTLVLLVEHDDMCIIRHTHEIIGGFVAFDVDEHQEAAEGLLRTLAERWNKRI